MIEFAKQSHSAIRNNVDLRSLTCKPQIATIKNILVWTFCCAESMNLA